MILYIVRHGETEENQQKILQGHLPGTLTTQGKAQVAATAEQLAAMGVPFDAIVSSDLERAVDSAHIIGSRLHLEVETTPMLRERDWGEFTGMSIAEASERFRIDGQWRFPDGTVETEEEIYVRATNALAYLQQHYEGKTVIVVTHGQFARNLLAVYHHTTFRDEPTLANAEIRVITCPR